jgi:glycosyltransferase involved in cell wall biosynthesis
MSHRPVLPVTSGEPAAAGTASELRPEPFPVLYLIPTMGRGGAEGQLIALINRLDRRRFTPLLCCLESVSPDRRREVNCELLSLGIGSLFRASAVKGLLRIIALIRRHHIRVVHACFLRAEVLGVMARLLGRRTKIVLGKRDLGHYRYGWHERLLARFSNRSSDAVVANSIAVKACLKETWRVPQEKVEIIYNGVDLERFAPVSRERQARAKRNLGYEGNESVIAIVTHLTPVKGVEVFVAAAAIVARETPHARFVVVGGGPLLDALMDSARSLGIEKRISFCGEVADVVPYLAAADVGVLASMSEGFPNAILEYMAAGLPVVSTDVGGVAELLGENGECGYRVPAGAPAAMADRLVVLLASPELRLEMGARGRSRAKEIFGLNRMLAQYERLYRRLLGTEGA